MYGLYELYDNLPRFRPSSHSLIYVVVINSFAFVLEVFNCCLREPLLNLMPTANLGLMDHEIILTTYLLATDKLHFVAAVTWSF